jgi:hypothetical protein
MTSPANVAYISDDSNLKTILVLKTLLLKLNLHVDFVK